MAIHVVQGERDLVTECRSLARFELRGIPPLPAGGARIRVTFQVDADGLLAVSAREATTGVEASVTVKPSYGLSDDEVARMLQDSMSAAEIDMRERALREERVEAQRMLEAVQAALAADADLLNDQERADVDGRVAEVKRLLAEGDAQSLHAAIEALARATDEFAARRMDRSIRAALAGRRVDELAK
jgi:molecular chaperone HscA